MEDLERFGEALRLVERYEAYLFRRALGIALIVCGVIFPLSAFIVLKAQALAGLLNMSAEALVAFAPTTILLVGMAIIIYSFTSAHVVTSRMRKTPIGENLPHMVILFLVWFFSFYLTNYAPEAYTAISWLWAGGVASLISHSILKREDPSWKYPELLIVGAICLAASIPLLLIRGSQVVEAMTFLTFSLSFVAAGVHSFIKASKELSESDK